MQPTQDYKQLLTEVIKKQIVILGPDITLSKARNVKGLTVADDGTVTVVDGQPQEVIQALIDQFVQLSGLIVKKTMEPLLSLSQPAVTQAITPTTPPAPVIPTTPPVPTTEPLTAQPATPPQPSAQSPTVTPAQQTPVRQPTTSVNPQQAGDPTPANNPLAA